MVERFSEVLHGGRVGWPGVSEVVPVVDEIRPEMLKDLDLVGLCWLARLISVAWRSGTGLWRGTVYLRRGSPGCWVTFLKRGPEDVLQLSGTHTAQPPPGKFTPGHWKGDSDLRTSGSGEAMWTPGPGPGIGEQLFRAAGCVTVAQPVYM